MAPVITQINESQLKVTYDILPWFLYGIIWSVFFAGVYYLHSLFKGEWLISIFISVVVVLSLFMAGLTVRFIKKDIFIFDVTKKEIYKNGELYKKYEEIIDFTIDAITGDCSDDYELILRFKSGKLSFGIGSSEEKLLGLRAQICKYVKPYHKSLKQVN